MGGSTTRRSREPRHERRVLQMEQMEAGWLFRGKPCSHPSSGRCESTAAVGVSLPMANPAN
jgi:hypothetical protein